MLAKLSPEQLKDELIATQKEQQRIHAQIQQNTNIFNEEWSKWTTPRKIKRMSSETSNP
ncbi:hypothetical protein [Selenomonas sputigena]|uniref:hypothetical protein n=1 Tax=Selenomonas sputigena TaxID=69823 RepID=UPI002232A6A2|nr:hypothetical protein [Selenomonas sputigena]UZD43654.1 hypothetical protein OL240_01710 [Selenomonas sputigena]